MCTVIIIHIGEHLEFMDMLQNPTKHMSRTEQRKLKLKEIGVAVDDIEAQIEEDTEISLRPKNKQKDKPKAESTFKNYEFEVCFRIGNSYNVLEYCDISVYLRT